MVYFFVVIVVRMSWTLRLVMGAKLWRCQRQIRFSMQNNIGFNFYFHVCSDDLISHCEAFSCSRKRKNKMIETTAMAFPVWFLVIEQTKKKIIKKMFGVQQHTLNDTIFGHLRWCWPEPSARRLQCASKHNTHTHISQSPMMNYRLIGCMHLINSIDKRSKDHAHLLFAVVVVLAGCSFACLLKNIHSYANHDCVCRRTYPVRPACLPSRQQSFTVDLSHRKVRMAFQKRQSDTFLNDCNTNQLIRWFFW